MKKYNSILQKLMLMFAVTLSAFSLNAQMSGTYTIDAGNPTSGTNFNSFAAATTALKTLGVSGPVTINVVSNSGPYFEQVKIDTILGVTSFNKVVINGNGNKIIALPTATDLYIVRLNGADYVTLNNLVLYDSSDTYGWGVHLTAGANYNTITNCTIDLTKTNSTSSTATNGIIASSSNTSPSTTGVSGSYNVFSNNIIKGGVNAGMYYAIRLNGNTGTLGCKGNQIKNNTILDGYIYQIYLYYADSTLVEGNDISRPNKLTVSSFYGIYLSTGSLKNTIRKNKIHNTHGSATSTTGLVGGLYYSGADATTGNENVAYNNLIYDINNSGTIYGIYNSSSDGARYYFNTISLDYAAATAGTTYGFYQATAATGIEFLNNNISITRGGSGTKYVLYWSTNTSVILSNKNNIFVNSQGSGSQYVGYWNATTYSTLTDWKTANSAAFDQNSASTDPLYVNPAGENYKPAAASMNNIGTPITGITTDFVNVTRNVLTPDPGAYEFSPPADDAGLLGFTSPIAPCPGTANVIVTLKNFGAVTLDSVRINWSINGVSQPTKYYTTPISSAEDTTVLLGNFTVVGGNSYDLRAWTSKPNGGTDANLLNDSAEVLNLESAMSGTYTVGSTGNFSTVVAAVNALNNRGICGPVTIDIDASSGPYEGYLSIGPLNGTSSVNTVKFLGHGATITDTTDATRYYIVLLNGASYVTLDSLNIVNGGVAYGMGIILTNKSDHNTISNCYLDFTAVTSTSSTICGIISTASLTSTAGYADNANYNTIINNTIEGGSAGVYYGIRLNGQSTGGGNRGNIIKNNTIKNIYVYNIYSIYGDSLIVEGNDISRAGKTTVSTFYGINLTTGMTRTIVRNNRIHNTHDNASSLTGSVYGIYTSADATSGSENKIYNNLLYNINSEGTIYVMYSSGDYTEYYYNTISLDHTSSTSSSTTYAFYQPSATANVVLKNNIFSVTRGGTGTKYGLYFNSSSTNQVSDNNVIYMNASGTVNYGYWGSAVTSFSGWLAVNSGAFDQNSDDSNPEFISISSNNYVPNSIAANNMGVAINGITTDLSGASRNATTPDPGVFEFTPIPANDSCLNAITITAGTYNGTTTGSSLDLAPTCVVTNSAGGVWYKYTSTGGFIKASLCGSSYDTRISVFTGSCSALTCVTGNEDFCSSQSEVSGCNDSNVTYYVLVHGNGTATGNFTLTVSEVPVTPATISVTGNTSFCPGDSVVLTAGSNATYSWNDSILSNSQSISVFNSGNYQVVTTDSNGCSDSSAIVSTQVFTVTQATITPNGPTTFCEGDDVLLQSNVSTSYQWNDSTLSTGQSILVSTSGTFEVVTTDSNGCNSTSAPVTTTMNPLPVVSLGTDTTICNNVTVILDAGAGFVHYDWTTGDTTQTISFVESTPGNYTLGVAVTDNNTCENTDEIVVTVDICGGIGELNNDRKIHIYPNPANDFVLITTEGFTGKQAEIRLNDINGRTILTQMILTSDKNSIDVSHIQSGIYYLNVIGASESAFTKVIIE